MTYPEGWSENTSIRISNNSYKYNNRETVSLLKQEGEATVTATLSKDGDTVILYIKPSEEDGLYFLGEYEYTEENINTVASQAFSSNNVTIEELREQFKSLQYFDEDLNPKDPTALMRAFKDEQVKMQLVMESMFVNKLQTVARDYAYREDCRQKSVFTTSLYYNKITDPYAVTDAFGSIKNLGMKMTKREFRLYKQLHDELYKIDVIQD